MPLFQPKKHARNRTSTVRQPATIAERIEDALKDQHVLPRVLVVLLFLGLMVVVVRGWKPVFPYRLGDRVDHGITARTSFKRIDQFETERIRAERIAQVPFYFKHDPLPLSNLPAQLRTALRTIAESSSLEDLPLQLRSDFALAEPDHQGATPTDYQKFKEALGVRKDATSNQIDQVLFQFQAFIAPLAQSGLINPEDLLRHAITAEKTLAIISPKDADQQQIVSLGEVQLNELLKDTGKLGKSWSTYPDLDVIKPRLKRWLTAKAPFTLQYDQARTKEAKADVTDRAGAVYFTYSRGDLLREPGQVIDDDAIAVLAAEYDQITSNISWYQGVFRVLTVFLLLLILVGLNGFYFRHQEPQLFQSARRLAIYLGMVVITVGLSHILSEDPWRAEVIPLLVTVMVFSLAYNQVLATVTALNLILIITLSTGAGSNELIVLLAVCASAIIPLSNVGSRSTLVKIGFAAGVVYFLCSWGTGIVQSQFISDVWTDTTLWKQSLLGATKCLIAGYFVAGSLPFVESLFDVVTDISLLELSDVSHPLLQELVRRAPGTYNHSIAVATIGETAAESIGANGLLLKVAAYFHDVGKMLKPQYFIENVASGAESRHKQLAPAMSTLVIIGHVKDGVDLARQHNLPQRVIDFVEQHHGTTLVEYFYREATKQADAQPDHKTEVQESNFRYPGPKPQSKETAVMMLSDAVESASRTLSEPTPKRIEGLVRSLSMKRLMDGQFDESPLTLNELRIVEESLIKSLIGIYHGRIKYPDQQTA